MTDHPWRRGLAGRRAALRVRFEGLWKGLTAIGDEGAGGYRRFAWTPVDLALRGWFREQAALRGLSYELDRNGNQWAWWGTPGPGAVVTGSHLDSVPGGGAFDGPLGVVSAFLAVDELRERCVVPARPIAVVNFADEEGSRFGVACVGSRLLTGILAPDEARALRDGDGVTLAEALQAARTTPGHDDQPAVPDMSESRRSLASHQSADHGQVPEPGALREGHQGLVPSPTGIGRDDLALGRIGVFVELHIEQGRGLDELDAPIGVASAIWPHGRWRCTFHGEANHAGTTRLADRHDPMLPFASAVLAARQAAEQAGALATFGKVRVDPNGTNAIPSRVDAWLDGRAPDAATVDAMVGRIAEAARGAGAEHGVRVEVVEESSTPVVEFGDELRDRIAATLGGVPALPTGAGHDAGILSASVPSAMLFVRNRTGVSHSPAEHAETEDCVAGVVALTAVLEDLACR
ncbi:allantoate amidohydrolase [Sphaerisporangium sp. NPDC088356]|uniref:allantoate amidohydrolase n=1 Tax=Sphaerisporangium sp. NPDC088356 TaxID=3154871 RepID=UPI00342185E6